MGAVFHALSHEPPSHTKGSNKISPTGPEIQQGNSPFVQATGRK